MVTAAALAATAAVAQAPSGTSRGPDNDPNEVVCINERVIGSRLARNRVCRTRAQWVEHRAETRKVVERVQFNKQTSEQ
ncbi:MAG TPA: hypothetical protein VN231_13230 [Allosphingosinicella sp.]|nr:hypothetical protein [Allosphingosinicella sp.]